MGKIVERIAITEEHNNYLQLKSYEADGYKSLVKSVIISPKYEYNKELYEELIKMSIQKEIEYKLAWEEIMDRYLPTEYRSGYHTVNALFNDSYLEVVDNRCNNHDSCGGH